MEDYSYTYAKETYCIPDRWNKKIPMSDLFDMLAGTSTGSIMASSLSMPAKNGSNKFWS